MAIETLTEVFSIETVAGFGKIALWLQTIGIITLILLISNIVNIISALLRRKREKLILEKLKDISKKIEKIDKKKK